MINSAKSAKFSSNLSKNGFINLHAAGFVPTDWNKETGALPFSLTNDFIFHALAQHNERILKALISAGMHVDIHQIESVVIKNPILLSDNIAGKEFILDILVIMNHNVAVNLEMQVINYGDWPERSLTYLCREYGDLSKGGYYSDAKTAVHIGFLDFTLSKDEQTLWSSYRVLDVETFKEYSDKFQLYVISLPMHNHSSEKDRVFHTDLWAKFFKAKTYEDLKMLALQDPIFDEAAQDAYSLWTDERTRWLIERRQEYADLQLKLSRERSALEERLTKAEKETAMYKNAAEAEKSRADMEKRHAAEEKANAEKEKANAEKEKARADVAEAKYKELLLEMKLNVDKYAREHNITPEEACHLLQFNYSIYCS